MYPFKKMILSLNYKLPEYPFKWVPEQPFCVTNEIVFNPFDYMVVRFIYTKPEAGSDLDIMIYYDETGTIYDKDAVGYGQSPNTVKIPLDSTPDNDSYLWWANDDVSSPNGTCVEAVVIGIDNFNNNNVVVDNFIKVFLRVGWYSTIGSGNVVVQLETYLGGAMSKVGTNIINTGGTLTTSQIKNIVITSGTGQVSLVKSNLVGTITYDKTNKTATLI